MSGRRVCCFHPGSEVGFEDFVDESFQVDFDIVTRLQYINSIIHVQVTLSLDRNLQAVVDHVHKDVGRLSIWHGNSKVINLLHKEDPLTVNSP